MEKPVRMHIGNNNQNPFLPKNECIQTSGHFWINWVLRAKKLKLSRTFFGSPGTRQCMPQQENLTGL
jgi:hypothetical protein